MEMRAKKTDIYKLSAILIGIICMVFFGMHLYKNAEKVIPENPISGEIQQLTVDKGEEIGGENGGDAGDGQAENDELSDENNRDNSIIDEDFEGNKSENVENIQDNGNQNENLEQSNSQTNSNENSTSDRVNSSLKNDSESDKKQNGGIDAEVNPDGESEIAYFKTTIKENETVNERLYHFTITHLQKDLKLRSQRVYINGEEVLQFSGKCTLSEGENTIRVSCTYTQKDNTVQRAYKDYTVYCYTENIGFSTDLLECTVNESRLNFYAKAFYGEKNLPVEVKLNGVSCNGEENFSVTLAEGENEIKLSAEYNGKNGEKTYRIIYEKPLEFGIETDLFDQVVSEEGFDFSAKMVGNSSNAKLTVAVNGKSVTQNDGIYHAILKKGENSIRVRAKDGEKIVENIYTISYVPKADNTTKPVISAINLTDSMIVRGSNFSMSITARDYLGDRIYADKIDVYVNNVYSAYEWQNSTETGYFIKLNSGENAVMIRVFDNDGRYADYFYTIICQQAQQGEEIGRIQIDFDAKVLGFPMLAQGAEVPIYEGENAMDIIKRFLDDNGYGYEISGTSDMGYYLERVTKNGAFANGQIPSVLENLLAQDGIGKTGNYNDNSLGEFDYTQGSGWTMSINGSVTSYGISRANFADGDLIRLTFTLGYGRDILGSENAYEVTW